MSNSTLRYCYLLNSTLSYCNLLNSTLRYRYLSNSIVTILEFLSPQMLRSQKNSHYKKGNFYINEFLKLTQNIYANFIVVFYIHRSYQMHVNLKFPFFFIWAYIFCSWNLCLWVKVHKQYQDCHYKISK